MTRRRSIFAIAVFLLVGVASTAFPLRGATLHTLAGPVVEGRPLAAISQAPKPGAQAAKPKTRTIKAYTLPPEKYRQAVALHRARYRLYFLGFLYGVLVYLLVLRGRLGPKYRDWAERCSPRRVVQAFIYAPLLLLTLRALNLPRSAYSHWLLHKFGLSVQGWGSWAWDWAKAQLLTVAFGTFLVCILYGLVRRSPRRWWFYLWLAAQPIMVFQVFVDPLVVEPLFYRFEPLAARRPELVAQFEKVAQRGGLRIPPDHIFEMEASEKLRAVNAYVSGIGASKRVVVWDTTLAKLSEPQVLAVFGHEMGHYVLAHIPKGMALFAVALLVFLFLACQLLGTLLGRWGHAWAIRGVDDWASLPVLLLLVSVFAFLAAPVENACSRYIEHQADIYGLEVTHGIVPAASEAAAESFQIEGEINLEDPHPSWFIRVWLYDHPPLEERLIFAQTYDPWSKGEQPKYVPAP